MTVDVLIPVYKPDRRFARLLAMLGKQTVKPDRIIVMNTEQSYWREEYRKVPGLEVHHLSREEFNHGATRNQAASCSDADVMIFMTDDAVPRDSHLVERLLEALAGTGPKGETIAVAYARQLPDKDCRTIERYTRMFNYPAEGTVKTGKDLARLGIKTYFASNVCCAYRKDIFVRQGGFTSHTIFNEDMIYAAGAIRAGYGVAYEPRAMVVHSHNLSLVQQFRRNFDLAVSQADHPEVFAGVPSEGEGIRLVKRTAGYLAASGRFWLLPALAAGSAAKYLGYKAGRNYRKLPRRLVLACSMSPFYWKRTWAREEP
ncbi:MAG: glycosyltransferase family 2 protein [Lachnospiraceae bacterium]|nr:glycosyltransferase family 2 protein [Lachnospiraceae bacterium]